jgi:hypothetical protein
MPKKGKHTGCEFYVWAAFGGELRLGKVIESQIDENKWKHFRIEWVSDEIYKTSVEWQEILRPGEDFSKDWYRRDEVAPLDLSLIKNKLAILETL